MNFIIFILTSYFLNTHNIQFEKPNNLEYEISFIEEKIENKNQLTTKLHLITSYLKEKESILFKAIKQSHTLNNKIFINSRLENKEFISKTIFKNGLFIPQNVNFINQNILDLVFLNIKFPKIVNKNYSWEQKKSKIIKINNKKYYYKEIINITFVKKEKKNLIFNLKYKLKNNSTIQKNLINLTGNSKLIISQNKIKSINSKFNLKLNNQNSKITCFLKLK